MIITNSRYALVGYFITSYPKRAHGIIVIYIRQGNRQLDISIFTNLLNLWNLCDLDKMRVCVSFSQIQTKGSLSYLVQQFSAILYFKLSLTTCMTFEMRRDVTKISKVFLPYPFRTLQGFAVRDVSPSPLYEVTNYVHG